MKTRKVERTPHVRKRVHGPSPPQSIQQSSLLLVDDRCPRLSQPRFQQDRHISKRPRLQNIAHTSVLPPFACQKSRALREPTFPLPERSTPVLILSMTMFFLILVVVWTFSVHPNMGSPTLWRVFLSSPRWSSRQRFRGSVIDLGLVQAYAVTVTHDANFLDLRTMGVGDPYVIGNNKKLTR